MSKGSESRQARISAGYGFARESVSSSERERNKRARKERERECERDGMDRLDDLIETSQETASEV